MPKLVKKEAKTTIKATATKTAVKKSEGFAVPLYTLDGKESGNMEVSKEVFGGKINKPLLAQAIRVYLNNITAHFSNTKTRGEVSATTRKLYKQKGTGGARHGSKKAPIFVGGGIALGPKYRKITLDLPKKMKKAALIAALSSKMKEKEVVAINSGEKASGKTSQVKKLLAVMGKKNVLIVTDGKDEKITNAAKNLVGVGVSTSSQLNVLTLSNYRTLVLTKEAIKGLENRVLKSGTGENK